MDTKEETRKQLEELKARGERFTGSVSASGFKIITESELRAQGLSEDQIDALCNDPPPMPPLSEEEVRENISACREILQQYGFSDGSDAPTSEPEAPRPSSG